jgi:mono/diheme cytochrome c family protein
VHIWPRFPGRICPIRSAAQASTSAATRYQETVLPVLAKNCFSCHSERVHTAGLSLEALQDPALALQKDDVWTKVLDKLKAGTMPPRNVPQPSAADVAAVTVWIESLHSGTASATASATTADPGRVTARRLNRTEYNNTIHDLLGVTIRPADEFPADDSGYGFDNIGDVLSLSPMLMEKYMSAARAVSKAAVFGESYPLKPTRLTRLMPKKIQDDLPAGGTVTPFSARGAMYTMYHVPVDAEYEFRFRYQNFRGGEPVVTTDGTAPARGAGRGRVRQVRRAIQARRQVRVRACPPARPPEHQAVEVRRRGVAAAPVASPDSAVLVLS